MLPFLLCNAWSRWIKFVRTREIQTLTDIPIGGSILKYVSPQLRQTILLLCFLPLLPWHQANPAMGSKFVTRDQINRIIQKVQENQQLKWKQAPLMPRLLTCTVSFQGSAARRTSPGSSESAAGLFIIPTAREPASSTLWFPQQRDTTLFITLHCTITTVYFSAPLTIHRLLSSLPRFSSRLSILPANNFFKRFYTLTSTFQASGGQGAPVRDLVI